MNFLAHFHIAYVTNSSFAGALLGDPVKGAAYQTMPKELAVGIQLHRRIDSFTNQAPQLHQVTSRFAQGERRFAGIVLDVLFDHLLAINWHHYSNESLPQFSALVYRKLTQVPDDIWPGYHELADRMCRYQWLENYVDPHSIQLVFDRLQQRFSRPVNLQRIAAPLLEDKAALTQLFHQFYPDLLRRSQIWTEEFSSR